MNKRAAIRAYVHPEQKNLMMEAADNDKLDQWMITTLVREALKELGFTSMAEWLNNKRDK